MGLSKLKKTMQEDPAVAQLLKLRTVARKALASDSNDAEHDALYEIEGVLTSLTAHGRRTAKTLKA